MVKYLLDALSSLDPPTANDGAHRSPDAPQSTEQSVLIMIGQALTTAATVSPEQAGRRRNIFAIAAALPPAPPSISAASILISLFSFNDILEIRDIAGTNPLLKTCVVSTAMS